MNSINGRGADYVEVPSGVTDVTIAVYGMTASHFFLLVSAKAMEKLPIANPQIKAYSISSDRVSLMWLPPSGQSFTESEAESAAIANSGSSATRDHKYDAAADFVVYSVLEKQAPADDTQDGSAYFESSGSKLRENLLETPCGMVKFGQRVGEAQIQTQRESKFFFMEIKDLLPDREYTFNVLASGKKNGFSDAAYTPVRVRTLKFDDLRVGKQVSSSVEKGKYKHFKLAFTRPEVPLAQRDNFYRDEDAVMRFTLVSKEGDADLFISLNVGPATFSSSDFTAEALAFDQVEIPITETYTTCSFLVPERLLLLLLLMTLYIVYIGVFGKEAAKFTLRADEVSLEERQSASSLAEDAGESVKKKPASSLFDLFLIVLEALLDCLA